MWTPPVSCAHLGVELRCKELPTALVPFSSSLHAAIPRCPPPAALSSHEEFKHDKSLYAMFGEDEELIENCRALLDYRCEFQARVLQTDEAIAVRLGNGQERFTNWATILTGPQIREIYQTVPEVRAIFDHAISAWVKSCEAIEHAVFVLVTYKIHPEFASYADVLGLAARNLQMILSNWQWVIPSGLLTEWESNRLTSATAFRTSIALGSSYFEGFSGPMAVGAYL